MSEEKEKMQLIHNGEYIHDFYIDLAIDSPYLTKDDLKRKASILAAFIIKYPDEIDHTKEKKFDFHNYLIEDVECGVGAGGVACGPVSGPVVVTVKFNDGEKSQYLSCCEFDGFPYFYLTEKNVFDYLIGDEDRNEEMEKYLENNSPWSFEDVELRTPEYYDIYKSIRESKDYNAAKLIRYVLNLVNFDGNAIEALIERSVGRHISEFFVSRNETEVRFDKD